MDIVKLSTEEASRVLCLFLAQSEDPEKPHEQLGFDTAQSAFEGLGQLFQRKENTIKNERDAFDYYTDSPRVGWKSSLKPSLESIWEKYGDVSRAELLKISQDIIKSLRSSINMGQRNIFEVVASLSSSETETKLKVPTASYSIEISNTGRRGEKWFTLTLDEILQCLEDLKKQEFQCLPSTFNEERYRDASLNFSRETSKTLGGTQTLPMFSALAKLIQVANNLAPNDKNLDTDKSRLDTAIRRVLADATVTQEPAGVVYSSLPTILGENIIFYGAPGTGKSTEIKKRIGTSPNVTTVFHPDMQNSDFIGALKPAVKKDNVTYKFSPGPFAEALSQAYNYPDQNVYLVIEELNRAPAMAVFGELFQLLDRKDNGESVYGVSFPSEEFQAWLIGKTGIPHKEIRLPSNFSIWASMNSADQGVYPLDTAFRRRWNQEYIHIDWSDKKLAKLIIDIIKADGSKVELSWKVLGEAINNELEDQYPEDRLLGQWWINNRDVKNSNGLVPNKLLNYLWDDLLRHDDETKKKIFKADIKRFGQLMQPRNESQKKQIFSDEFLAKILPLDE